MVWPKVCPEHFVFVERSKHQFPTNSSSITNDCLPLQHSNQEPNLPSPSSLPVFWSRQGVRRCSRCRWCATVGQCVQGRLSGISKILQRFNVATVIWSWAIHNAGIFCCLSRMIGEVKPLPCCSAFWSQLTEVTCGVFDCDEDLIAQMSGDCRVLCGNLC